MNQKCVLSLSMARAVIRILIAFLLSRALHACASYTLLGPTRPWSSFSFFALEPLGMAFQCSCSHYLICPYVTESPGRWKSFLGQGSNFGFMILWLWASSILLIDDLTSGGIWLLEPIPVSLIRGLGFNKNDKRLWCW